MSLALITLYGRVRAATCAIRMAVAVVVLLIGSETGFAKVQARQPVLTASAVAVADRYGAEAAEQILKQGGKCR